MSAELLRLAATIDGYFKPSFLFDVYQTAWRQRVSPSEGTDEHARLVAGPDGALAAPLVRFASITAKDDVLSAAKAVRAAAGLSETMTAEELSDLIKAAVVGHAKLIAFVEDAAQGRCVRRNAMLSEDDSPIVRSVHMKPVHQSATEEEIRSFVANHVAAKLLTSESVETISERIITGVSKRAMVDVSANGVSRTVFYAQVEFVKKAVAELFVKLPPTYTASDALLQHYLPPLKVALLSDHLRRAEEVEATREAARNMNLFTKAAKAQEARHATQAVIEQRQQQQQAASSSTSAAAAAAPLAEIQVTEQFLTPGKTLKITGLPQTVTWRDVKVKLSNLFPDEKRLIRVVKEHEGNAYVVLFSPEKMEPLLSAWAADTFCHNVVPSLARVEGEEEKWAMEQYPSWVGGFVTKKVVKNSKFAAKRNRE